MVTVKDVAYYAKDHTLLDDVKLAKIYRTGSLEPQRLLSKFSIKKSKAGLDNKIYTKNKWQKLNKIFFWVFIPDSKLLWSPFAVLKAYRLIRTENIKYILTTSPPHSIQLAGLILKWMTGVCWTADFRDGWSGGNFQYEPTFFHKWVNRLLERVVLKNSDRVIGVSQKLVEYFKNKSPEQESDIFVLTNGFDSEDIAKTEKSHCNDKFTLTFCGSMTSIAPVDDFLAGLSLLLKKHADFKNEILVKLIGMDWNEKVEKTIYKLGLESVVTLTGYLCHHKALEEIVNADLLIYPIADWASRDFIPGKTFEYLASGNPVLVIGPEVEGVCILKSTAEVVITNHKDLLAIEQAVLKYFTRFKQKSIKKLHNSNISIYEREYLTEKLVKILDEMD